MSFSVLISVYASIVAICKLYFSGIHQIHRRTTKTNHLYYNCAHKVLAGVERHAS